MVSFRDQALEGAAEIVEAIVSECDDAALTIEKIELESDLKRTLVARACAGAGPLITIDGSGGEIRLWQRATAQIRYKILPHLFIFIAFSGKALLLT